MEEIFVTVWCLAYNHEKYIRSALDGFVSQKTNFKYEVIVHDDASTDSTAKIIREYEVKYPNIIKPIYQKQNQYKLGVNKVFNYLLPNAKGKYIAYCEGDDFWIDENKLQKQFDYMEKHSNVTMCTHKVQCLNEDCSYNERVIPELKYELNENRLILQSEMARLLYTKGGYPFHTSSYFIKKDVLECDTYKQLTGKINGDQLILRSALSLGDIYYLNCIMSNRRLLTIGNWNSRFKSSSDDIKMKHYVNMIEGDILFDKITCSKYNEIINPFIYKRLLWIASVTSDEIFYKIWNEYRNENKFPYGVSFSLTMAYWLFLISPRLYRCLTRIKKK